MTIVQYLWSAFVRDKHKAPPEIAGWRDTRDVAEAFGISMSTARRRLLSDGLVAALTEKR